MKSKNVSDHNLKENIELQVNIEKAIYSKQIKESELDKLSASPKSNYLRGLYYYIVKEDKVLGEKYFSRVREEGNDDLLLKLYRTYLDFGDDYIPLADSCLSILVNRGNELAIELAKAE